MISTKKFDWSKANNSFIADVSELSGLKFIQAYPDACDVGFDLVSHKSGEILRMVQIEEYRNNEGDTLYWKFKPVNRKYSFVVTIFND